MMKPIRALGVALILTAGPAVAALAATTAGSTTPGTMATSPAQATTQPTVKRQQAEMSAEQRNEWAAKHPHAANTGSYSTRSGVSGGGGEGGGAGGGSGSR